MSAASHLPSFDPGPVRPGWKDSSGLTEYLREVSLFLRLFGSRLRVGEHSRSPLRLISLHITEGTIWCDWVARDPDPWDSVLPEGIGRRHASLQALKDAIDARALIFGSVQEADCAQVRVYRRAGEKSLETIICGSLRRHEGEFRHIHSIAMRAKLLGFTFHMADDLLTPFRDEDQI